MLLKLYIPPGNDEASIRKLFDIIAEETSGVHICRAEWNIQPCLSLDTIYFTKRINPESGTVKRLFLKQV